MAAAENESVDVTKVKPFDGERSNAFSILAHDVKTPITSIRMTLHMLLEEKIGHLNPDQRELIEAAREDCEHMLSTIPSLLELARFQNDCVKMNLQRTPPETLLKDAESRHEAGPQRKAAPVTFTEPREKLPLVDADAVQVGRILENLIFNAAKSGIPNAPIILSAAICDEFVRLSVRNRTERPRSGIGDARPLGARAGRSGEGAAFGLKICSEIARTHGGRIGFGSGNDYEEYYLDLRRSS